MLAASLGCEADTAELGRVAAAASAQPAPQANPATPPPTVIATPRPVVSTRMATPVPATPGAPTPAVPSASATPVAPGSPSPSPSDGAYTQTGLALDLAVSGPAFFVLATKPDPAGLEDLLFTRNGHLKLETDTAGGLNLLRLKHGAGGFHLVGYLASGGTAAGAPDERTGTGTGLLTTRWGGADASALGLFLDAQRNPDAQSKLAFDFTGRLSVAGASPRGVDGGAVQAYVALASFATPAALVPQPGFDGVYKWTSGAGAVTLGTAVSGPGRTLGNANLLLTGQLEHPTP